MNGNEIPYRDLRASLANVLNRIEYRNESFVVTRRGKPVARLIPYEEPVQHSDWRERARARVGDKVDARTAELMAEPPMSAEEFDEAMRLNKEEAEEYLHRQSVAAFGEPATPKDADG